MDTLPNVLLQQILEQLRAGLTQLYGPRLKKLLLFGSHARDEATEGSDIDVAVILDDFDYASREIDRSSMLISELCLRYDCLIGVVPIRERDWLTRQDPFLMNVRREAIPLT